MRQKSGFALFELLILLGIIMVIASIAVPNLISARAYHWFEKHQGAYFQLDGQPEGVYLGRVVSFAPGEGETWNLELVGQTTSSFQPEVELQVVGTPSGLEAWIGDSNWQSRNGRGSWIAVFCNKKPFAIGHDDGTGEQARVGEVRILGYQGRAIKHEVMTLYNMFGKVKPDWL